MQQEKHYRHELKYMIPYADYTAMRKRLWQVMKSDPHTMPDGTYLIRSIYFDNTEGTQSTERPSLEGMSSNTEKIKTLACFGACLVLLVVVTLVIIKVKRK